QKNQCIQGNTNACQLPQYEFNMNPTAAPPEDVHMPSVQLDVRHHLVLHRLRFYYVVSHRASTTISTNQPPRTLCTAEWPRQGPPLLDIPPNIRPQMCSSISLPRCLPPPSAPAAHGRGCRSCSVEPAPTQPDL